MKAIFLIFFAPCIMMVGCKKSNTAGSAYTKLIAGTRDYMCTDEEHYRDTGYTIVDTATYSIQYINPGTITLNSVQLSFAPSLSNDTILSFNTSTNISYGVGSSETLKYNINSNTIIISLDNRSSAAGYGYANCASL